MQYATTMKRFALTHLGGTALAFGILVSSLTAVATLSLTGDLPGVGDSSANVADTSASVRASAADAEQRQLSMERDDYLTWQRNSSATATDAESGASENPLEQIATLTASGSAATVGTVAGPRFLDQAFIVGMLRADSAVAVQSTTSLRYLDMHAVLELRVQRAAGPQIDPRLFIPTFQLTESGISSTPLGVTSPRTPNDMP